MSMYDTLKSRSEETKTTTKKRYLYQDGEFEAYFTNGKVKIRQAFPTAYMSGDIKHDIPWTWETITEAMKTARNECQACYGGHWQLIIDERHNIPIPYGKTQGNLDKAREKIMAGPDNYARRFLQELAEKLSKKQAATAMTKEQIQERKTRISAQLRMK